MSLNPEIHERHSFAHIYEKCGKVNGIFLHFRITSVDMRYLLINDAACAHSVTGQTDNQDLLDESLQIEFVSAESILTKILPN